MSHRQLTPDAKVETVDALFAFNDDAETYLAKCNRALQLHGIPRQRVTVAYHVRYFWCCEGAQRDPRHLLGTASLF